MKGGGTIGGGGGERDRNKCMEEEDVGIKGGREKEKQRILEIYEGKEVVREREEELERVRKNGDLKIVKT